jgi:hypothetical protein
MIIVSNTTHWYLHKFLDLVFPAAMPPDVPQVATPFRKLLDFLCGYALMVWRNRRN